jgi:3-methyladenine DNA glycosylase AlkC
MNYQQKLATAQNPNTPPEILEFLATDREWYVRRWVAPNPNASQETLKLLATDKDPYVRAWVIQNPNKTQIIERLVLMTNHKLSTATT